MRPTERFTRQRPRDIDPAALEFLKDSPEIVLEVLTKVEEIEAGRAELPKIHGLPADLQTVEDALLELQKAYFENNTVACIARLGHYAANRQSVDWLRVVSDRHLPQIVFSLIDPEIIKESIRRLVPSEGGIDEAVRAELRAKANKKIADAKKWIVDHVPDALLHEGDYRDGPLHAAYRQWHELAYSFTAPVDPFGCACPAESPWFNAYRTLGFRANEDGGRFSPAPYDEFYYR